MRENFGTFDGEPVERIRLNGGGLTANILTWGATIQDLRLEGHDLPLVLGFAKFEDYLSYSPYFGATVGRFANRISQGRFSIDGREFQLDQNETSGNHLHGGTKGISHRNWKVDDLGDEFVQLSILDKDGQSGYPGNCQITCRYLLRDDGILDIIYSCQTDTPTLANIAHHSYFNLDGSSDIFDHEIMIKADHYLPVSDTLIPSGAIEPVDGSDFDLRNMRSIRSKNGYSGYDHNFCLSRERRDKTHAVCVRSPKSGVQLDIYTTEPGVQFYTGIGIRPSVEGISGRKYELGAGFCLETQIWPDAPNHPAFPNAILEPASELQQQSEYKFTKKAII